MDQTRQTTGDMPLACSLTDVAQRERQQTLQREVFSGVREVRELADGTAVRFPGGGAWVTRLTDFIRFERDCCPFFTFELHCEPRHGPLWLHLRGPAGVKEFVATLLPVDAAPQR